MAINDQVFKNALKRWASGIAVVTTNTEKFGLQGMTVTSFTSVSLDSHKILVCLNQEADTSKGIFDRQSFAINVLNYKQEEISNQFAGGASQAMRFKNVDWYQGTLGLPLFKEALVTLECTLSEKLLVGTHWIVVGEIQSVNFHSDEKPLLYFNSAYHNVA